MRPPPLVGPLRLQRLGLLLQHRQPHGDGEPVDPVFTVRMQIFLHLPHVFATVGHQHYPPVEGLYRLRTYLLTHPQEDNTGCQDTKR